jgi:hypothetical protein
MGYSVIELRDGSVVSFSSYQRELDAYVYVPERRNSEAALIVNRRTG